MKTIRIFSLTLLFSLLTTFLFIQCEKDESIEIKESAMNYLALSIDAEDFIQILENDQIEFTGIFAKVVNGEVVFEKVNIENHRFKNKEIQIELIFSKIIIKNDGEIQNYTENFPKENLSNLPENFDFAYFPWDDLKLIAQNSEKIYITEAKMIYGASIHLPNSLIKNKAYLTLKIEGDFKKSNPQKNDLFLTPMYLIGHTCPPIWQA